MDDKYLLFGQYPQTKVNDESLIDELSKLTEKNNLGYYEYNKMNYAKQVAVPDSFDLKYLNLEADDYNALDDNHVYGTFNDGTKIIYGKTQQKIIG